MPPQISDQDKTNDQEGDYSQKPEDSIRSSLFYDEHPIEREINIFDIIV